MKHENPNVRNVNKWQGYYLEDTSCEHCLYFISKKKGCSLKVCCCEDIKIEAKEKGRIKRKRGFNSWDM
jgi:hypothetical protein